MGEGSPLSRYQAQSRFSEPGRFAELLAPLPVDPEELSAVVRNVPVSEEDAAWLDQVAELLAAADEGNGAAEQRALERYRIDEGLHPGATVVQASPLNDDLVTIVITQPATT